MHTNTHTGHHYCVFVENQDDKLKIESASLSVLVLYFVSHDPELSRKAKTFLVFEDDKLERNMDFISRI